MGFTIITPAMVGDSTISAIGAAGGSGFEPAIPSTVEHERSTLVIDAHLVDPADDDEVVAGDVFRLDGAVQPGQHSGDDRGTGSRRPPSHALEAVATSPGEDP